jgi:A/G-specific adenine glycosylase
MEKLAPEEIVAFQKKILLWYGIHQRDLPWRKTRNPYHILVSEVMLQQTQVSRVIPKFEAWIKTFPTVHVLAHAPIPSVLAHWSGLGYNRRALNLKRAAQGVVERFSGHLPQTEKDLLSLPGIGPYTARALLCFAFDKQVAVVDTNVRKVIFTQLVNKKLDEKALQTIAEAILPYGKAYEWNQALMDYASAILKNEKIPIPKQSKFIGSHRYYRGKVLKVLLEKKTMPIKKLGTLVKHDFSETDHDWFKKLLEELGNEGFIVIKNKYVELNLR